MEILCQDSAPYRASVLIGFDEDRICVTIKRIWIKHLEGRKRLVGYQFVDPPENILGLIRGVKLPIEIKRVI